MIHHKIFNYLNQCHIQMVKVIPLILNIKKKRYIQTPRMKNLFGLGVYKDEKTDKPKDHNYITI